MLSSFKYNVFIDKLDLGCFLFVPSVFCSYLSPFLSSSQFEFLKFNFSVGFPNISLPPTHTLSAYRWSFPVLWLKREFLKIFLPSFASQIWDLDHHLVKVGRYRRGKKPTETSLPYQKFFEFWLPSPICLPSITFQGPQVVAFSILARAFSCNQWEIMYSRLNQS